MVPFIETITTKEELIKVAKAGYKDYINRVVTKNDFLVYFGFTHGEAITKYYSDNNYQVLLDAGFNTGSEAYFSAGINAWKNLKSGAYIFPPLYYDCNDDLINLRPGDSDGVIFITSEDSLCFYVLSESRNSSGLRTISKDLLREFIKYEMSNPESSSHDARMALSGTSSIDKYEYGYEGTLWRLAKLNRIVPKRKVEEFCRSFVNPKPINLPLQQIFYGAPGTGKSHGIKKQEDQFAEVIRTTFHPDSDYSTFVGAYKPTMKRTKKCVIIDKEEREITPTVTNDEYEERISYTFVKQAFIKAYIAAWKGQKEGKSILLVIEEINRGNCAQIFGDLFQLLDREESGYSSYPISADEDLHQVLKDEFSKIEDIPANVKSGEELLLPNNLFIWATMNTSDQSLFPIDSAFKRRWDWTYVPIKYEKTEWRVVLSDKCWCSWKELQTTLNDLIYDATESEDKMLGDWFVKADEKNEITEEQLVGKIIFYLWNDVAKVDAGTLFDLEVEKRGKNKRVTFSDFYKMDGKTDTAIVKDWLTKIGITINEANPANDGISAES